jgi:hypothetical protein
MAESPTPPTALDSSTAANLDNLNEVLANKFDFNEFLRNAAFQLNQVNDGDDRDGTPPMDEDEDLKPLPPPKSTPKGRKSSATGSAASGTPNSATMTTASALACLGAPHPTASQFSPFQPIRPGRHPYLLIDFHETNQS